MYFNKNALYYITSVQYNIRFDSKSDRCLILYKEKLKIETQDTAFIVEPRDYRLTEPLPLDCGRVLNDVNIRYETAGTLNADASNAVLVTHALSGDAHVCGKYTPEDPNPAGGTT